MLYFIVLKHPGSKHEKPSNYRFWTGLESNYEVARSKALSMFRGFKIVHCSAATILEFLLLSLPFFNIDLNRKK